MREHKTAAIQVISNSRHIRSDDMYPDRKKRRLRLTTLLLAVFAFSTPLVGAFAAGHAGPSLESGWNHPPLDARLRAYWWWLNGNVTRHSITRDLEQMKAKGFGGAVLIDANGANQMGNAPVPHGPTFFSPPWRALYKHALHVAHRLGLQMSLNIQSGWNLGGPGVKPDDAAKIITWSGLRVRGPTNLDSVLPKPKSRDHYYRDTFVVAYPIRPNQAPHRPLENWRQKALYKSLQPFSAPPSTALFEEYPATPGEEDTESGNVTNLTARLDAHGVLHWQVPPGEWEILRLGCTIGPHAHVSTSSDGWHGYALDVFDAGAFNRYWRSVVEPLISDAGPLAGNTLKYLHTDSWEIEPVNWTPTLPAEFQKRFGYSMVPFLPVLAGRIVDNREMSDRFLADFRKTLGELTIDHHYKLFKKYAHRHGLLIHPESGGPHAVPIDAQRDLGWDDAPMSEFWAWSWMHRIGDSNRFFMFQPASAAHTYGHRLVLGEGFTSMGPNWQSRLADNLKPAFDKALCEGLNLLVWHAFVCSPASMGIPGQQYFAGTHLNPNVTWWKMSAPFFAYINRCQFLLQRGLPVSDVLYYYGDHVPNFAQLRGSDPAHVGQGYDYDVITEEAILQRLKVKAGRWVLPDGVSYRLLVIPNRRIISLPVLRKLKRLVDEGGTLIGPKPDRASGLKGYPACDRQVRKLAGQMWGGGLQKKASSKSPTSSNSPPSVLIHRFGKGRVFSGRTARKVLLTDGVLPDFSYSGGDPGTEIDYIHRRDGKAEIYFVASRGKKPESVRCTFRVSGKAPELWDPVSGKHRFAAAYTEAEGRTTVPLDFAPCGAMFVIFREPTSAHPPGSDGNSSEFTRVKRLSGAWTVAFDPRWGGPASTTFEKLESWTERPEPGIKYYSGTATYRKTFDLPAGLAKRPLWIDLGDVRELARVKLNGHALGIVWCPPYRVNAAGAVKPGANRLEIQVVNFWCNRVIGDQFLPPDQRFTRTNIRFLTRRSPLMISGLLGPVRLLEQR